MALFDALIRDVAAKFGLGAQAGALVTEVLRTIVSQPAGLSGFLDKFRSAGLGDLVASWIGKGQNSELSAAQLQKALGGNSISQIASKVGLTSDAAAPPLAFAVPRVVDQLTPDGTVPATLPAAVTQMLGGTRAAEAPIPAKAASSGRTWLWPLLALLAILIGWWAYSQTGSDRQAKAPAPPPAAPTAAVQPAPKIDARLALANDGGTIRYDGVVGDEQTKTGIIETLAAFFGAGNIRGDIRVDPQATPAAWFGQLKAALEHLKIPGTEFLFEGKSISVGGLPGQADVQSLIDKLKGLFGADFSVGSYADRMKAAIAAARQRTLTALGGLGTTFKIDDLLNLLNLSIINFETASAEIVAEDRKILESAAAAIKAAPANTRIEVGGHTDSIGDDASNLALSQARAEAVRVVLIEYGVDPARLAAKGYGETKPVADNGTEYGRFKNRRISYVVLPG